MSQSSPTRSPHVALQIVGVLALLLAASIGVIGFTGSAAQTLTETPTDAPTTTLDPCASTPVAMDTATDIATITPEPGTVTPTATDSDTGVPSSAQEGETLTPNLTLTPTDTETDIPTPTPDPCTATPTPTETVADVPTLTLESTTPAGTETPTDIPTASDEPATATPTATATPPDVEEVGDRSRIVFVSQPTNGGNHRIDTINPDGSDLQRILDSGAVKFDLVSSRDGARLAFTAGGDYRAIYTMNADGSDLTRITNNPFHDSEPSWSPDGTRIIYSSYRNILMQDIGQIYVMNADGSNQTRLTHSDQSDSDPSWSPDGSQIVFVTTRGNVNHMLYLMNSDGSNQRLLYKIPDGTATQPQWSPDGKQIVFTADNGYGSYIAVINADGTGLTALTEQRLEPSTEPYAMPEVFDPSWSPDGSQILSMWEGPSFEAGTVTITDDNGNTYPIPVTVDKLMIMNADGSNPIQVPTGDFYFYCPVWLPIPRAAE